MPFGQCLYSLEKLSLIILSVLNYSNMKNEDANSMEVEILFGGETQRDECN